MLQEGTILAVRLRKMQDQHHRSPQIDRNAHQPQQQQVSTAKERRTLRLSQRRKRVFDTNLCHVLIGIPKDHDWTSKQTPPNLVGRAWEFEPRPSVVKDGDNGRGGGSEAGRGDGAKGKETENGRRTGPADASDLAKSHKGGSRRYRQKDLKPALREAHSLG